MEKKCCICGKEFNGFGNNAHPIKEGLCCDKCNSEYLVPVRRINFGSCPVAYEVVKVGQPFLDLGKKLYEKDFEYIGKVKDRNIKLFRHLVTDEYVVVCIV